MDITAIEQKARQVGIAADRVLQMGGTEMIEAIQAAEGFEVCFGTKVDGCRYPACCWSQDCRAEAIRRASAAAIRALRRADAHADNAGYAE